MLHIKSKGIKSRVNCNLLTKPLCPNKDPFVCPGRGQKRGGSVVEYLTRSRGCGFEPRQKHSILAALCP